MSVEGDGGADGEPAVPVSWRELLGEARARLGSPNDARRIVERASGFDGAEYHLRLDDAVTVRSAAHFEQMVERRATGEPLQYVRSEERRVGKECRL